jgi:hypothetical protein
VSRHFVLENFGEALQPSPEYVIPAKAGTLFALMIHPTAVKNPERFLTERLEEWFLPFGWTTLE